MATDLREVARPLFKAADTMWTNTALGPDEDAQPTMVTLESALHTDPEAVLTDAQASFFGCPDDIAKAERRITYLTNERDAPALSQEQAGGVRFRGTADPAHRGCGVEFVSDYPQLFVPGGSIPTMPE